jgi:nitroimidazol reductase NimA-like FMN-containing flavoprotein (pyridoxamine 5'-phosphate oxidase superfamily)
MKLKVGTRILVQWDDSNPEIDGKEGVVVKDSQEHSPNWTDVQIEGQVYSVRGSEVQIVGRKDANRG